jgi:hypothetical protein
MNGAQQGRNSGFPLILKAFAAIMNTFTGKKHPDGSVA